MRKGIENYGVYGVSTRYDGQPDTYVSRLEAARLVDAGLATFVNKGSGIGMLRIPRRRAQGSPLETFVLAETRALEAK